MSLRHKSQNLIFLTLYLCNLMLVIFSDNTVWNILGLRLQDTKILGLLIYNLWQRLNSFSVSLLFLRKDRIGRYELLLFVTFCCFLLLFITLCCFLLLFITFCYFLLLFVAFCYFLLLFVAFCYFLLLFVAFYYFL